MTVHRQHNNLFVALVTNRGKITEAALNQTPGGVIQLTPAQLYALVDDVAVADPDEWARRFDPRGAIEQHLRQVADYLKERSEVNRRMAEQGPNRDYFHTLADALDLGVTACMEEIESLYDEQNPTQAVNGSLNRRNR